jgi:hypothetical protein
VSEVDLDATSAERQRLCEEIRLRAHVMRLFEASAPSDGLVRVTPYRVVEDEDPAEAAS